MRFIYENKRFLLLNMYLVYNIRGSKCSKVKLTLPSLLLQVGDVRYLCRKLDGIYFLCCITKLPHNQQIKTIYSYYLIVFLSDYGCSVSRYFDFSGKVYFSCREIPPG